VLLYRDAGDERFERAAVRFHARLCAEIPAVDLAHGAAALGALAMLARGDDSGATANLSEVLEALGADHLIAALAEAADEPVPLNPVSATTARATARSGAGFAPPGRGRACSGSGKTRRGPAELTSRRLRARDLTRGPGRAGDQRASHPPPPPPMRPQRALSMRPRETRSAPFSSRAPLEPGSARGSPSYELLAGEVVLQAVNSLSWTVHAGAVALSPTAPRH